MDIQEVSKALDESQIQLEVQDNEEDLDIEEALKKAKQLQEEGKYQESLVLMLKYRTMLQQEGEDEDTLDTTKMWREMGIAHWRQGKYPEAMRFHKRGLHIYEDLLSQNDSEIATSYLEIGKTFWKMADYTKALEFYDKSYNIRIEKFGQDDEALEYYKISLEIRLKKLGDDHPDVSQTYNNMA